MPIKKNFQDTFHLGCIAFSYMAVTAVDLASPPFLDIDAVANLHPNRQPAQGLVRDAALFSTRFCFRHNFLNVDFLPLHIVSLYSDRHICIQKRHRDVLSHQRCLKVAKNGFLTVTYRCGKAYMNLQRYNLAQFN